LTLLDRSFYKDTTPHVPSRRKLAETLQQGDAALGVQLNKASFGGGSATAVSSATEDESKSEPKDEVTYQGEALDLLAGVADKVLALGRGDEAERILGTYMANLLGAARIGVVISSRTTDKAAAYAVKLAAVTAKGSWVDYAITLFLLLKRPLPAPVVDELYGVLRKVSGVNLSLVRDYVAMLHEVQGRFGPAERFVIQRIAGLERLAASR
jgi:hypothetical protein